MDPLIQHLFGLTSNSTVIALKDYFEPFAQSFETDLLKQIFDAFH